MPYLGAIAHTSNTKQRHTSLRQLYQRARARDSYRLAALGARRRRGGGWKVRNKMAIFFFLPTNIPHEWCTEKRMEYRTRGHQPL